MQPPFPIGAILQNRYRLIQILGQGGFGRTYLAADQNRFNEHCVLKELVPEQDEPVFLAKAKDLFYKEAKVLYGIQHPQVPEFREQFEFGQRLFLVQQYVPGQTCEKLLEERRNRGAAFSEPEVKHLLLQILPVLSYLHDRQIIHRDISPDNIILRQPDLLPVLIDFGAVKELATRVSQPFSRTMIGKPLYAPVEQLQMGSVNPTADLYSLAVTAIVLLTGREPGRLYDPDQRVWHWQAWAKVSREFAEVLCRMLSDRPSDRYPSAEQVRQLLQATPGGTVPIAQTIPIANAPLSQMPTQAVGRRPLPQSHLANPGAIPLAPTPPGWHPVWQRMAIGLFKFSRWLLGLLGMAIAGLAKWLLGLVPKWLVLLGILAIALWAYQQFTGRPVIPKLQFPKIELPQIKLPDLPKLPNFSLDPAALLGLKDNSNPSAQEKKLRDKILNRQADLQIDHAFFNRLVNQRFFAKYPELAGKPLSETNSQHRQLRQTWYQTADVTLDSLQNLLSKEARSQLGSFTAGDLERWRSQIRRQHLSYQALYQLADARFFGAFPEQRQVNDLLSQPEGQIWQGIVSDYVNAMQAGRALEAIAPQTTPWRNQFRDTLVGGAGKAFVIYLQKNQRLQLDLQASGATLLSSYSPTGKVLLNQASQSRWSATAFEEGYYELLVISNANNSLTYELNLAVN
jgi:serine/threonine-protein kinase